MVDSCSQQTSDWRYFSCTWVNILWHAICWLKCEYTQRKCKIWSFVKILIRLSCLRCIHSSHLRRKILKSRELQKRCVHASWHHHQKKGPDHRACCACSGLIWRKILKLLSMSKRCVSSFWHDRRSWSGRCAGCPSSRIPHYIPEEGSSDSMSWQKDQRACLFMSSSSSMCPRFPSSSFLSSSRIVIKMTTRIHLLSSSLSSSSWSIFFIFVIHHHWHYHNSSLSWLTAALLHFLLSCSCVEDVNDRSGRHIITILPSVKCGGKTGKKEILILFRSMFWCSFGQCAVTSTKGVLSVRTSLPRLQGQILIKAKKSQDVYLSLRILSATCLDSYHHWDQSFSIGIISDVGPSASLVANIRPECAASTNIETLDANRAVDAAADYDEFLWFWSATDPRYKGDL